MAVLVDCAQKVSRLLQHANSVQGAYETARDAYDRLETGQPFDANWLTLAFQIGDQQVPVPVPQDRATLQAYFLEAINHLAGQLEQIWVELHNTTSAAVVHIQQAAARADESVLQPQAPPAIAPFPQPQQPPFPQATPVPANPQPPRPTPPAQPPQPAQGLPASIQLPPGGVRIPTVAVQ